MKKLFSVTLMIAIGLIAAGCSDKYKGLERSPCACTPAPTVMTRV